MIIALSPIRMETRLQAERLGAQLVLNGTEIDLAAYDADLAPNPWIIGQPGWDGGQWRVTLLLPHGAGAPEAALYPAAITDPPDGPLDLPA